jgi:hypothetical protein
MSVTGMDQSLLSGLLSSLLSELLCGHSPSQKSRIKCCLGQDKNYLSLHTTLKMSLFSIILGLILAFHVTAQRNHGDYSDSVQEKMLHHTAAGENFKRQLSIDPISSFFSSLWCPLTATTDCQTSDTDTATVQPAVQTTVQTTMQTTVQPTVQTSVSETAQPTTSTAPPQVATQSCHATDHYYVISYSVLIGVPYAGAADCDATYHALESATYSISNWQCVEKDGNIQLWFAAFPNYGPQINSALESRYPSVAGGFNCPSG